MPLFPLSYPHLLCKEAFYFDLTHNPNALTTCCQPYQLRNAMATHREPSFTPLVGIWP